MSDKYKIAETDLFLKKINKNKYKKIYKKISEYIYPLLRKNPYFGPNIKRLKVYLFGYCDDSIDIIPYRTGMSLSLS